MPDPSHTEVVLPCHVKGIDGHDFAVKLCAEILDMFGFATRVHALHEPDAAPEDQRWTVSIAVPDDRASNPQLLDWMHQQAHQARREWVQKSRRVFLHQLKKTTPDGRRRRDWTQPERKGTG